jgi:hypothetical protein
LLLGNGCQPVGIVCYFLNGSKPVQLAEALAALPLLKSSIAARMSLPF